MKVNGATLRILHRRTGLPAAHLPIGALVEKLKEPCRAFLTLGLLWASVWGLLLLMAFVALAVVNAGNEMWVSPAPIARDALDLPVDHQPETNSFEEDPVYYVP